MRSKILLLAMLLAAAPSAFAQRLPFDINFQLGLNTTLSSIKDYAANMQKLSDGAAALNTASNSGSFNTNTGGDLNKVIQGYNGAASALAQTLANTRFGLGLQLGLKPLNTKVATVAVGLGSGFRIGFLENVAFPGQEMMVMFDIPVQAYVALELLDFLRFDGFLGMVFSASSQNLADFTARPIEGAQKGIQLLDDAFNAPKFDMLLRVSLAMFYAEINGSINVKNPKELSLFRVGLGINLKLASILRK